MPFDIQVHITEDSQRGRVIQMIADQQHVTLERAIEQLIDAGINAQHPLAPKINNGKTPAELLFGLFSSSKDNAMMDEVTILAYEGRHTSTRDTGL